MAIKMNQIRDIKSITDYTLIVGWVHHEIYRLNTIAMEDPESGRGELDEFYKNVLTILATRDLKVMEIQSIAQQALVGSGIEFDVDKLLVDEPIPHPPLKRVLPAFAIRCAIRCTNGLSDLVGPIREASWGADLLRSIPIKYSESATNFWRASLVDEALSILSRDKKFVMYHGYKSETAVGIKMLVENHTVASIDFSHFIKE